MTRPGGSPFNNPSREKYDWAESGVLNTPGDYALRQHTAHLQVVGGGRRWLDVVGGVKMWSEVKAQDSTLLSLSYGGDEEGN